MSTIIPIQPITPASAHEITKNFHMVFPPPQAAGMTATFIPVFKFDGWAVKFGYLPQQCEQATLVRMRNQLRNKIHNHALTKAWTKLGYPPFTVRSTVTGEWLAVDLPLPTFDAMTPDMPGKMLKAVETKKGNVFKVLAGVDKTKLHPTDLVRVENLEKEVDAVYRNMEFVIQVCNREILRMMRLLPKSYITQYLPAPGSKNDPSFTTVPNDDEVNDNEAEEQPEEEAALGEDNLVYDVAEEAAYIADILKEEGFTGEGLELVEKIEETSRFTITVEGGFAPEEIVELVQAVRELLSKD